MIFTATCLFGLEALLGAEIDALGCRRISTIDGRVTFEGDEATAARANITPIPEESMKVTSFRSNTSFLISLAFVKFIISPPFPALQCL